MKRLVDSEINVSIRPERLNEYIGQKHVVENLSLAIAAAKKRNEPIEHCLLYGPPGIGKTTLAHIIAKEMGSNIITISGPSIEKVGDIAAILTSLDDKDVLFVDEIHRLNRNIEEMLYSALEDFKLDIVVGQGPGAKTLRLDLPRFTFIGATTRIGMLTNPLRDRFGLILRLDYYSLDELVSIIKRSSFVLNIKIDDESAQIIAQRSRSTPRIANKILRRVRDLAQVKQIDKITKSIAQEALEIINIDENGLDYLDKKYLDIINNVFNGGPVGIETLASSLGEDKKTLEEVVEPYLLQCGYIKKTPKGRVAVNQALTEKSTLF
ncbi:Holliday junction branch migration DNA helicase RuvB [Desulfurella multipotens]|jgi:Holliday junction DNA helicase RuvB|uniref:Holliday junction branch migration DNA helicase RuvB n=1 Tax=Desulfurella TaxID=33001 RepID=UPI000CBF2DF4|nr:Holliday junction branch migration DNA helicase RuvB [Desulfurella multipotens]PMP63417.1 MAG: Holliday junction branch migration DNA helicase RuvB [Desulfurella multipotens]